MIIWSGRGFVAVLALIIAFVLSLFLVPGHLADLGLALTFLAAGAFTGYFGKQWNEKKGRIVIDKETGQEIELKSKHTLFWIKMQYWGYVFIVIGLLFLLLALFQ